MNELSHLGEWLSNTYDPKLPEAHLHSVDILNQPIGSGWKQHQEWLKDKLIGPPKAGYYSVEQLRAWNYVGVYAKPKNLLPDIAATHNPDNLSADKLPEGFRFLNVDELAKHPNDIQLQEIISWSEEGQKWSYEHYRGTITAKLMLHPLHPKN